MGQLMGAILQMTSTLVVGFTIAFINGWELTLIMIAILPIIGLTGAMQIKMLQG
jgi:ATP-binding cassette subfamily B (MDR/TAP) protein 1